MTTAADAKGPGGERLEGGRSDEDILASADQQASDSGDAAWDEAPLETPQLAFADEEVRLPWLESDGDDEEEYTGYGAAQLAFLLVLGALALALIGGGIWWAIDKRQDDVLIADGSVVAAPEQPYKERPEDPGGKTFAGTGDTSFAVSEGQTRPARLDQSTTPPPPPPAKAEGSPAAAAAPAIAGVGVQVAAYSNREQAEAGWSRLTAQYEPLADLPHRVVEGQADIGTVYRLQAVAADSAAARALCRQLKDAGLACQVKN